MPAVAALAQKTVALMEEDEALVRLHRAQVNRQPGARDALRSGCLRTPNHRRQSHAPWEVHLQGALSLSLFEGVVEVDLWSVDLSGYILAFNFTGAVSLDE